MFNNQAVVLSRVMAKGATLFFLFILICIGAGSAATITFVVDGDGAVAPEPITAEVGEYITLPTPVWSGHTFSSWAIDIGYLAGIPKYDYYNAGDRFKVTQSDTFYANWIPKRTLTFDVEGDGAPIVNPITVDEGTYVTLPTPIWEGHTFSSWAIEIDDLAGIHVYDYYNAGDRFKVTQSDTFYSIWIKQYAITFDGNANGVESSRITGDKDSYITLPSLSRDKYTLKYWTVSETDSGTRYYPGDSYKITGSQTFYAQWEINKCTVLFETNGGTEVDSQTVAIDSTITLPGSFSFGNEFTGWYLNGKYVGSEGDKYVVTDSVILSAGWKKGGLVTYLIIGGAGLIVLLLVVLIARKVNTRSSSKPPANTMKRPVSPEPTRPVSSLEQKQRVPEKKSNETKPTIIVQNHYGDRIEYVDNSISVDRSTHVDVSDNGVLMRPKFGSDSPISEKIDDSDEDIINALDGLSPKKK